MYDFGAKGMTGRHVNIRVYTKEVTRFLFNELDNEKLNKTYLPDQMFKMVLDNVWERLA
jgi:hypothetical protein